VSSWPEAGGAVLVRLPNWLGDTLMARPFLAALRRAAGRSRVVALAPAPLLALLEGDAAWDTGLAWPPDPGVVPRLRAERFAAAFVLPPSFSSAWFAWRCGARERIGYAGDARSPLLTRALGRRPRGDRHLAREFLALLGEAAVADGPLPLPPPLRPGTRDADEAADVLAAAGVAGGPLAILAPGAVYGPAKRWPVERFAALARMLRGSGCEVVACGGSGDGDACAAVAEGSGGACVSLAGRTSLGAQAALCARAHVVVSNDSGLAHLAAAAGAPTVTIFGSTSSAWTAPLGARVRIVQRPPVCSPCFRRTCAIGYGCLVSVGVRDVAAAIDALAGADAGRGAA
jgi:heptosyltransferase-2